MAFVMRRSTRHCHHASIGGSRKAGSADGLNGGPPFSSVSVCNCVRASEPPSLRASRASRARARRHREPSTVKLTSETTGGAGANELRFRPRFMTISQ